MTEIIKRTTLIVRNAEAAARWYEQVFGFTRWMDLPFTLSGKQLASGRKGDQTRLIIMRGEDDTIGMIGLLEWVDPVRDDIPAEFPDRIGFGTPIFVVASKDCRACVARARAAGSRIHCKPHSWTVTGADGREQDMLGASFWDLDGNFYEVNEVVAINSR